MSWLDNIRKQRAAKAQMTGVMGSLLPGLTRTPPDRGVSGMLAAYGTSPWVCAVASKIGTSFGSVQWRAYAARDVGSKFRWRKVKRLQKSGVTTQQVRRKLVDLPEGLELVEIPDSALIDFIDAGSPMFPGNVARSLTQIYLELTGEAFWLLDVESFDGGGPIPTQYYPVPPTWVLNTPTAAKPSFEVKAEGTSTPIDVPAEFMMWFMKPNPLNPYKRGLGRMRSLGDEIDTDEYASKFVRAWFFNRARPDLLIYGKGIDTKEAKRLEAKWMQKLRGYMSQHLPFFLSAMVEVKDLSQKLSDMQLNDLRNSQRDRIIQGRGVPPEMFGIVENSNRATISAAGHLYQTEVIVPELEFMREALQNTVVPLFDDRLILGYESPVDDDLDFQLKVAETMPAMLDMNEWRALGGWEEDEAVEGLRVVKLQDRIVTEAELSTYGNRVVEPEPVLASTPAARLPSNAATPPDDLPPERALPASDTGQDADDGGDLLGITLHVSKKPMGALDVVSIDRVTKTRERIVIEETKDGRVVVMKQIGGLETTNLATELSAQMIDDLAAAWADLAGALPTDQIATALGSGNVEAALALIDGLDVGAALENAVATLRQAIVMVGGVATEQLVEALGLEVGAFEIASQAALEELAEFGAGMVTNVGDETIEAIRSALVDSYANGNSPSAVAKEIRSLVGLTEGDARRAVERRAGLIEGGMSASEADAVMEKWIEKKIAKRAETIAVNELVEAGTRGQEIVWEEAERAGLIDREKTMREWIANPGACQLCQPNHGLQAKLGAPFETLTAGLVYTPNDIHVRCRCGERLVFVS